MNRAVFFDHVRPLFGRMNGVQVGRIEAVLDGFEGRDIPLRHRAYILATAHHESDQWKTMEEYASGAAYEGRKDLGNTHRGDGRRFKGRGLVQITGRRNYTDWAGRLGRDLVGKPELAATLAVAVPVLIDGCLLGTFTGAKLADFKTYRAMRAVVNGLDRADLIAGYAERYEAALIAAEADRTPAAVPPVRPDVEPPPPKTAPKPQSGASWWLQALWKIFETTTAKWRK
jgi:predicted chitinase